MDARRRVVVALIIIVLFIIITRLLEVSAGRIHSVLEEVFQAYRNVIYTIVVFVAGVLAIQILASAVMIWLKRSREAYLIRNVVIVLGYIVLGFAVAAMLGVGGESLLASATFSGLVIGLALQPVLSNFFSGLLILLSGFIKPGQDVRIAGNIPVSILAFPAYKFFSRDHAVPSLRGRIIEIGFMYTKILDIDGQIVKIPNNILLSSSIVLEEIHENKKVQIRYEFPVSCDPDAVLSELDTSLRGVLNSDDYSLYIEEQSDKQYYIVLLTAIAPPDARIRDFRSRLLKEFINIHRKLMNTPVCAQKPQG